MKCSDIRLLAERHAAGFELEARDENALARHLTECSACAAVARFENALATTVREFPAVKPPADFADMLLAGLPEPVVVPEPSFHGLWLSSAAGVAAAGVASWCLWEKSAVWMPWLSGAREKVAVDTLLYNATMSMGQVSFSTMSIVFVALIGLTAWGASLLVDVER